MFERNILIIDDNKRTKDVYIPAYTSEINKLKQKDPKWERYSFNLSHFGSMKEALDYLSCSQNYVDVLVVDYDFKGETTFSNGTEFVKHIRENINRHCQIVFYTMQGIGNIDKEELVNLINSDVYKIIDKSKSTSVMCEALFEAATRRNPVVESLERFLIKYSSLLEMYEYKYDGETISFVDIINHIRMDDSIGRSFVDKLLQKAILINTEI